MQKYNDFFLDDFNRVKLLTVAKNDYINASLVLVGIEINFMLCLPEQTNLIYINIFLV